MGLLDVVEDIPVVGDAVKTAEDATNAILDTIGLKGAPREIVDLVTGPLSDFFSTPVGSMFAHVLAGQAYSFLAPFVGPQLAAIGFALPDMIKGSSFDKAWTHEFLWRLKMTAGIMAGMALDQIQLDSSTIPADQMLPVEEIKSRSDQLIKAGKALEARYGSGLTLSPKSFDFVSCAKSLGVREDVLLEAAALLTNNMDFLRGKCTDAKTGKVVHC